MTEFSLLLTLGSIHLVGLMSPGPDFALVVRNSTLLSPRLACLTALGLACGILLHTIASITGISLLIRQTPILFNLLQLAGASYLFYMGYSVLKASCTDRPVLVTTIGKSTKTAAVSTPSPWQIFRAGFLTNLLNPKALVYFVSIISAFLNPELSLGFLVALMLMMFSLSFGWFALLALFLSSPRIQQQLKRREQWIHLLTGSLFCLAALTIIFNSALFQS